MLYEDKVGVALAISYKGTGLGSSWQMGFSEKQGTSLMEWLSSGRLATTSKLQVPHDISYPKLSVIGNAALYDLSRAT